jgi:hypothetical protein
MNFEGLDPTPLMQLCYARTQPISYLGPLEEKVFKTYGGMEPQ